MIRLLILMMIAKSTVVLAANLSPFTLSDQYDHQHVIDFRSNTPRVLIVADQASAATAREWGADLVKSPLKSVVIVPIAAMGDVPEFFQRIAKSYVTVKRPTLLDWGNRVSKRLGYVPNECLVTLVSGDGRVLGAATGRPTPAKLERLVRVSGLAPILATPSVATSDQLPGLSPVISDDDAPTRDIK